MRALDGASRTITGHASLLGLTAALLAIGFDCHLIGVLGRLVTARRTGGRAWPDALAHPASIATYAGLTALSGWRRRTGTLRWKGRTLPVAIP